MYLYLFIVLDILSSSAPTVGVAGLPGRPKKKFYNLKTLTWEGVGASYDLSITFLDSSDYRGLI